jgi:uncharacterized phage protein gp47/JayE
MPFNRPTLQTLIARACADVESRLKTGDASYVLFVRRQLLGVLGRMEGGLTHGLYGYLDWLALQLMPDTAEREHLERWSTIWGISRKAATPAEGLVRFEGDDGAVIPAGAEVQRRDGVRYAVRADAAIGQDTAGEALVSVLALEPGLSGNAAEGAALQLSSPVPGVKAQASAHTNLVGGADEETDASLRARLLTRIQRSPSGGSGRDYVTWALEVAGVTRAWCYPGEMGPGSVTVRFMMDDAYPDGIPLAEDVARVQAHIDTVRPVTADLYVVAPVPTPVDLDLRITPDTPRLRVLAAEAAWAALRRDAVPGGVVIVSRINEAISLAEGEEDHALLSPAGNLSMPAGCLAVPGAIVWEDA